MGTCLAPTGLRGTPGWKVTSPGVPPERLDRGEFGFIRPNKKAGATDRGLTKQYRRSIYAPANLVGGRGPVICMGERGEQYQPRGAGSVTLPPFKELGRPLEYGYPHSPLTLLPPDGKPLVGRGKGKGLGDKADRTCRTQLPVGSSPRRGCDQRGLQSRIPPEHGREESGGEVTYQ